MSGTASGAGPTSGLTLADRIVAIVSMRGSVGITQDELLRKLGVARDDLMTVLDQLRSENLVRIHWSTTDSFRVFHNG